jgi:predicted Rossmann fold nucleotide-binding protein DprA/Smf involved in DNA uptake
MATEATSDMGVGLGMVFGIMATVAAGLMVVYSYNYAIRHAQELETSGLLVGSGLAFGVAIVAGSLALVAIHVYAE